MKQTRKAIRSITKTTTSSSYTTFTKSDWLLNFLVMFSSLPVVEAPKMGSIIVLLSVSLSTILKLTISSSTFFTKSMFAGIITWNYGKAIMICSVLKMFHSCDMTPLRSRFTTKVKANVACMADSAFVATL